MPRRRPEPASDLTDRFVAALRDGGVSGTPCDAARVRRLERQLGVRLPGAYRAFLMVAGLEFRPWEGSTYTPDDDLRGLQRVARATAWADGVYLPQAAFVFYGHQGFAFRFFLLDGEDNPVVHQYVERCRTVETWGQLSAFLIDEVRRHRELWKRPDGGA